MITKCSDPAYKYVQILIFIAIVIFSRRLSRIDIFTIMFRYVWFEFISNTSNEKTFNFGFPIIWLDSCCDSIEIRQRLVVYIHVIINDTKLHGLTNR